MPRDPGSVGRIESAYRGYAVLPPGGRATNAFGHGGLAELRGRVVSLRGFVTHERAERRAAFLPTWPFDPAVTGWVAAITPTGVVAVLGRAAVDWLLAMP